MTNEENPNYHELRPVVNCDTLQFGAPVLSVTVVKCNHIIGYRHSQRDANLIDLADDIEPSVFFAFCPICGEELHETAE